VVRNRSSRPAEVDTRGGLGCNALIIGSVEEGMDARAQLAGTSGGDARADPAPPETLASREAEFDAWVAAAGPDLSRFARIATRSRDPTDLVQDALVAVFTRWSQLGQPGQAEAYARRVILNGHVSRWRGWGRRVTPVDPLVLTAVTAHEQGLDQVLIAQQLLATLPAVQRAAVFLRFYDDLTYRQIAEVIGCREATARSHVHRALLQLKRHLDEDGSR